MDESMDVRNLVSNANDVQIMKEIFFNEEQLLLLDKITDARLVKAAEEDGDDDSDEEETGEKIKEASLKKANSIRLAVNYVNSSGGKEPDQVERRINKFLRDNLQGKKKIQI